MGGRRVDEDGRRNAKGATPRRGGEWPVVHLGEVEGCRCVPASASAVQVPVAASVGGWLNRKTKAVGVCAVVADMMPPHRDEASKRELLTLHPVIDLSSHESAHSVGRGGLVHSGPLNHLEGLLVHAEGDGTHHRGHGCHAFTGCTVEGEKWQVCGVSVMAQGVSGGITGRTATASRLVLADTPL